MHRLLRVRNLLLALSTVVVAATWAGSAAAAGNDGATKIDWSKEPVEGARVVPETAPGGGPALRVDASSSGIVVHLVTIERPSVAPDGYALIGQVRYQGVQGRGYLEMWSVFPDGTRYFSRTLGARGPAAALTGSSDWRSIAVPFWLSGGLTITPSSLEVNLVLPGRGTVWLGSMELAALDAVPGTRRGWWSDRTAGVLGGVVGSLIGVLGAVIGALASRGRGRRFAIVSLWTVTALGAALVIIASVALVSSQPWAVWYSSALVGTLSLILGLAMVKVVSRRYAEAELRRMQAADAGSSLASQRLD